MYTVVKGESAVIVQVANIGVDLYGRIIQPVKIKGYSVIMSLILKDGQAKIVNW